MSNNPATDQWYYVQGPVNGLGTSAPEVYAVLHVSSGVCSEINNRVNGVASVPAGADLGNFTSLVTTSAESDTAWPFVGHGLGCVSNTNAGSTGDYFFQVLAIQ